VDGAPCGSTVSPLVDANGDGCVDVADVQSFAAVASRSAPNMNIRASAAVNPPLVVNSTGDGSDAVPGNGICATGSGTCTLRAAIQESNAQAGANTINFSIAGTGVQLIQLASALPTLSDTTGGTTIDGYSQPGAVANTDASADNAALKIEVRGTGPNSLDGIMITSANNTIAGIAFYNLRRVIYIFQREATANTIRGCFVGTNAAGTFGHTTSNTFASGIAIEAGAANNTVGGTALADRNVVSGNSRHGIVTYNEGSNNNVVFNNIIGLSPLGDRRLPNLVHGIDINAGSSFNVIGGTGTGMRNVISGNGILNDPTSPGSAGVELSHGTTTTGNQVVGNYFGTTVTGATAASWTYNAVWGVHIEDGANNTLVSDNVIVNSKVGAVRVRDSNTTQNRFTNNQIGMTATGQAAGNSGYSVLIGESSSGNTIGPGNIIINSPVGVWIKDPNTDRNTITENSLFANSGLGIDLDPNNQVNQNDPGDVDTGANQQLNFPQISAATPTNVSGTACVGCRVEVFIADAGGGAYGEGKTFVGAASADGAGQFSVGVSGVSAGQWLTTTATDANGNTSEFSENVLAQTGAATAPGAPSLGAATSASTSVTLQWSPPGSNGGSAITNYKIYRGTSSGAETFLTQVGNVTSYLDVAVAFGTTYYYKVSAINAAGEGPLSNERSATPSGTGVIVSDRFERTVATGLGNPDVGSPWSVSNASRTKVQNGEAVIYGWTGGNQDVDAWTTDARQDMELLALVRLNSTNPTGRAISRA